MGTVDKFQGQEAPIVIYSMATSTADEAPRGMEFLYSLHRLNVASSRARCVAAIVASPALLTPDWRTPEQMRLANPFCWRGPLRGARPEVDISAVIGPWAAPRRSRGGSGASHGPRVRLDWRGHRHGGARLRGDLEASVPRPATSSSAAAGATSTPASRPGCASRTTSSSPATVGWPPRPVGETASATAGLCPGGENPDPPWLETLRDLPPVRGNRGQQVPRWQAQPVAGAPSLPKGGVTNDDGARRPSRCPSTATAGAESVPDRRDRRRRSGPPAAPAPNLADGARRPPCTASGPTAAGASSTT